ncbi:hypothetical protein KBB96_14880 [Luteolibacter ambystomatis]|uniref:PEP-CTERM sorting domain-containing protein n=1 Tax=Luteolibacter ambystomatis TaxID=2824561 RepID=A0A975G721_9BACT|nr:hypothetical protein [Luteolibacter ambystomatis]QUE50148.1 hypothetical protein KBB96_14880 [Luteolibacter ambystomatis]
MVPRAFHPIVLAVALVALPAFAAWGRVRDGRPALTTGPVVSPVSFTTAPDGALMMPIEVVDAGKMPVKRMVEIQPVPEPSALLLLAPSLLLVLRRRR